jgi:hypothetical protein
VQADRARVDVELAAVRRVDAAVQGEAHGAPGDALGVPRPLDGLDDEPAARLVVEVGERLDDEPDAVCLDRGLDLGGEQEQR